MSQSIAATTLSLQQQNIEGMEQLSASIQKAIKLMERVKAQTTALETDRQSFESLLSDRKIEETSQLAQIEDEIRKCEAAITSTQQQIKGLDAQIATRNDHWKLMAYAQLCCYMGASYRRAQEGKHFQFDPGPFESSPAVKTIVGGAFKEVYLNILRVQGLTDVTGPLRRIPNSPFPDPSRRLERKTGDAHPETLGWVFSKEQGWMKP